MASAGTGSSSDGTEVAHPAGLTVHRIEAARQSRALTAALGGTSVAIFTFLLFFLYPRFADGEVNPILFQLTVFAIVACVYLLVFASWYFFLFTQTLGVDEKRPIRYLTRGDACFAAAVLVLTVTPALVLFTVNLTIIGFVSLAMWAVYLVAFMQSIRDIVAKRPGRPGAPK